MTFRGLGVRKGDIGCLEDFLLDLDLVERFLSGVVGFSASMSCDQFSVTGGGVVMKVVQAFGSPSHSLYCRLSLPLLRGVNICTPVFHLDKVHQCYDLLNFEENSCRFDLFQVRGHVRETIKSPSDANILPSDV